MQLEKNKVYEVKKEFLPLLNVTANQWKERKDDLLEWWKDFFDYEIIYSKPIVIRINEIYDQEYQPLPRKNVYTTAEKRADYAAATITILSESGKEYRPITKAFVAREATNNFGFMKYHHDSERSVAQRYIKPAFDQYAENNGKKVWCWSKDCIPLTEAELEKWKEILRKTLDMDEDSVFELYDKIYNKESLDKELSAYEKALMSMKSSFKGVPVYMNCWRANEEGQKESAAAKVKAEELEKEYQVTPITKKKEK